MINNEKIIQLIQKKAQHYATSIDFVNAISNRGLSKDCCMIVELIFLNKTFDRIKFILLYTDKTFKRHIENIYWFLDAFEVVKNEDLLRFNYKEEKKSWWTRLMGWFKKKGTESP